MKEHRSYRPQRVGEAVRRALSTFFLVGDSGVQGFRNASLAITEVKMSPDLRNANVYVRIANGKPAAVLRELRSTSHACRRFLAGELQLRCVPEVHFLNDHAADRANKIDTLLRSVDASSVDA